MASVPAASDNGWLPPPMGPVASPTDGLRYYQSSKVVQAGEIIEVVSAGCYVKEADGDAVLRPYLDGMTARYTPVAGDWWIVYPDGYQSISPRSAFISGYAPI